MRVSAQPVGYPRLISPRGVPVRFAQGGADIGKAWQDPVCRQLLEKVITKGMFKQSPVLGQGLVGEISRLTHAGVLNDQIYQELSRYLKNGPVFAEFKKQYLQDEKKRIQKRVQQLVDLVGKGNEPKAFADIGCGDGLITAGLAKAWQVPRDKALGMDVFNRVQPQQDFTQVPMTYSSLPLPDQSQDLILMLMVLHHEAKPEQLLREVYRCLKPGGRLIVREVDARTPSEKLFHDVLDNLYYRVYNQFSGIPTPATHESSGFWEGQFKQAGFVIRDKQYPEPNSPILPVHFVLEKV